MKRYTIIVGQVTQHFGFEDYNSFVKKCNGLLDLGIDFKIEDETEEDDN